MGLFKNVRVLTAANLGRADQPFLSIAARKYHSHSSQQLSSRAPFRDARRPRGFSASRTPFTVFRRCLNTDVVDEADAATSKFPTFGFAFDIDGVLLRSSKPIPGASEALLHLQKNNIPFILLTNGGGKLESERAAELSELLGVPLSAEILIQSHTPFRETVDADYGGRMPNAMKDKVVLVSGGDGEKCRQIAESYGYKNVVTTADIVMACPEIWPFSNLLSDSCKSSCRPLPRPIDPTNPANSLKIDAIIVFTDPRDWALDTQIIVDLMMSKDGVLGTTSPKNGNTSLPNYGYSQDGQPAVYFSNPDILWASAYHMPRLGQGSFQAALTSIWNGITVAGMNKYVIGKPHTKTFKFAQRVLWEHRKKLQASLGQAGNNSSELSNVFMVGDNPSSDIKGVNTLQKTKKGSIGWTSILVKTGVFQEGTKPGSKPDVIVDNVLDAVKWALKKEGWQDKVDPKEN